MRERRFGALHRYTCGRAACVGVAVTHLRRTSLVHLALRKETRLPIYYACAPRPAMFNKENERIARPTETQPVATKYTLCRCSRPDGQQRHGGGAQEHAGVHAALHRAPAQVAAAELLGHESQQSRV